MRLILWVLMTTSIYATLDTQYQTEAAFETEIQEGVVDYNKKARKYVKEEVVPKGMLTSDASKFVDRPEMWGIEDIRIDLDVFDDYEGNIRQAGRMQNMPKRKKKPFYSMGDSSDTDLGTIKSFISKVFDKIKPDEVNQISTSLVNAGKKFNVDPKLSAALIARESGFNKEAISSTGARGLGQIKDFNFPSLSIEDPHDIDQNVSGTTQYIRTMMDRWGEKKRTA